MTENTGSLFLEAITERATDERHGFLQTNGIAPENSAVDIQRRGVCVKMRYCNQLFRAGSLRLSVDIDLTYLPVNDRDFALNEIRSILLLISEEIKRRIPGTGVIPKRIHGTEVIRGLIVDREGVTVKIEPNLVLRGSVYPPEIKSLTKKAQDLFELSLQSRTLSSYDLYAGKICAALDRQHPRDLFDVH